MVEFYFEVTYPYVIRCWAPSDLAHRSAMAAWLDANVQWNKCLEIAMTCSKGLHFTFRVQSMEDVALVKMRC